MKNKIITYGGKIFIAIFLILYSIDCLAKYSIIRNNQLIICQKIEKGLCYDCFGKTLEVKENEGQETNAPCPNAPKSEKTTNEKEKTSSSEIEDSFISPKKIID